MPNQVTHWCHTCNRAIQINPPDVTCPHCHGGVLQELNRNHAMNHGGASGNMFHGHGMGPMGAIHGNHAMHDHGMGGPHNMSHGHGHNHGHDGMGGMMDLHGHHAMHNHGMGGAHNMSHGHGMDVHGHHAMHEHGMGGMGGLHGNHAMHDVGGHGRGHFLTDEIDDGWMMNNGFDFMDTIQPSGPVRRGDANCLQTVTITQRHVDDDSSCTVCMEKFELNSEVKETPCKHLFHGDCIEPWLQEHDTCPVCRQELSSPGGGTTANRSNNNGGTTADRSNNGGTPANGSNNGTRNGRVDDEEGEPNPWPWIFTTGLSLVILLALNVQGLGRPY